jgi:hypothetical protein
MPASAGMTELSPDSSGVKHGMTRHLSQGTVLRLFRGVYDFEHLFSGRGAAARSQLVFALTALILFLVISNAPSVFCG